MKKFLCIFIVLFLAGCSALDAGYDGENFTNIMPLQSPLASAAFTPIPSQTPSPTFPPSPTIDSQATAMHAQETAISSVQTSDAYVRANVQITSDYEQRVHDEMMILEQNKLAAIYATSSAAPASIAGTTTQQAFLNAAISTAQAFQITSAVSTQQAPTQIIALAEAQARADTAKQNAIVNSIAVLAVSIFLMVFSYVIYKIVLTRHTQIPEIYPPEPALDIPQDLPDTPIVPSDHKEGVSVEISTNNGAYGQTMLYTIPCTPAQLTRLAQAVLIEKKSLAINNWEGKKEPLFSREKFAPIRSWLQLNQFIKSIRGGNVEPTEGFIKFLSDWIQSNELPHRYDFDPKATDSPSTKPHEHEAHAPISPVGEGSAPVNTQNPVLEGLD